MRRPWDSVHGTSDIARLLTWVMAIAETRARQGYDAPTLQKVMRARRHVSELVAGTPSQWIATPAAKDGIAVSLALALECAPTWGREGRAGVELAIDVLSQHGLVDHLADDLVPADDGDHRSDDLVHDDPMEGDPQASVESGTETATSALLALVLEANRTSDPPPRDVRPREEPASRPRSVGPVDPTSEYITVGQAARIAQVSEKTIRKWRQKGLLGKDRFSAGRHQRIRRVDLEAFMRGSHERRPPDPEEQAAKLLARRRIRRRSA